MAVIAAFAALAGAARLATADTLAGYGEMVYRSTAYRGDLGEEFGASWLGWQLGGGLRVGQFAVGMGVEFHGVDPLDTDRHGPSLYRFGLGPDAKVFFGPDRGVRGYLRLGYRRSWIKGDQPVQRLCGDTGRCDAGFWWEEPSYAGSEVRFGGGIELVPAGAAAQGLLVAMFLDVGYDVARHDIIGREVTGGVVNVALGFNIGGGRLR